MIDCSARVVAFDFDGVLVNSFPLHAKAWQEAASYRGIALQESHLRQVFGLRGEWVVERMIHDWKIATVESTVGLLDNKRRIYADLANEMEPVSGAGELLNYLSGAGALLCVCTMASAADVHAAFSRFGWLQYFQVLVCREDVPEPKPDPSIYLRALHDLGASPEKAVAIEDSPPGIMSARGAGLQVIGVATTCSEEELRRCGATEVIYDLRHVIGTPLIRGT